MKTHVLTRRSALAMVPTIGAAAVIPNTSNTTQQVDEFTGNATPAVIATVPLIDLDALANRFFAANAAWLATAPGDEDLSCNCAEHDEADAACRALLKYQCRTHEEVQRKIQIVKSNKWLEEVAEVGFHDDHFWFRTYMETLTI